MLVALRVTIGWHFLYEGVWKIVHADEFSATPFLTMAKGPAAPLFYAMVYDIDGRQRLALGKDAKGKDVIPGTIYLDAWKGQLDAAVAKYGLEGDRQKQAEDLYKKYNKSLKEYLAENQEDVVAYFGSLDRFGESRAAGGNGAAHQRKRDWDQQQKLRGEVNGWLGEIDRMGEEYRLGLWGLLDDDQKALGPIPTGWTRSNLMDLAVTYSLTAIGFCMVVGLCSRLASLGGAAFLVSVLLTQPLWPTIYPPAPDVVGHAMVVDKNFVEMVAMVMLASLPVGQWGGLDFFLYRWFGRPVLRWLGKPVD